MNKPTKHYFVQANDFTACMTAEPRKHEIEQHFAHYGRAPNPYWYEVPETDAYIAMLDAKIIMLETRIDELNDKPPTVSDCSTCFDDGKAIGLEQGRKEGQTKLEEYVKLVEAEGDDVKLDLENQKTTKQLINQLYHEVARQERVIKDAVQLNDAASYVVAEAADQDLQVEDQDGKLIELERLGGMLDQFVDTHGEET